MLHIIGSILHTLAWPALAYGRTWAGMMADNGGDVFLPLVLLVLLPALVIVGICALIDSAL
jgi:hypothetical protein